MLSKNGIVLIIYEYAFVSCSLVCCGFCGFFKILFVLVEAGKRPNFKTRVDTGRSRDSSGHRTQGPGAERAIKENGKPLGICRSRQPQPQPPCNNSQHFQSNHHVALYTMSALNPHNITFKFCTLVIFILQMRKLRHWGVKLAMQTAPPCGPLFQWPAPSHPSGLNANILSSQRLSPGTVIHLCPARSQHLSPSMASC